MSIAAKKCTKCGIRQPVSAFYKCKHTRDKLQSQCKDCIRQQATKSYQADPGAKHRYDRERREHKGDAIRMQERRYRRSTFYGLTDAVALELRSRPCDICGADAPAEGRPHAIDHCHETGAVRGALCHPCNQAIGLLRDDPHRMRRAIWYVTRGADYRDAE